MSGRYIIAVIDADAERDGKRPSLDLYRFDTESEAYKFGDFVHQYAIDFARLVGGYLDRVKMFDLSDPDDFSDPQEERRSIREFYAERER